MKDYFLLLLFGIVVFGLAFFLIYYTKNIEGFQSLSAPLIESDTFLNNTLNPVIVQFRGVSNLFKIKEKFKEFITDWHNFSGNMDRNENIGRGAITVTYLKYDGSVVEERVETLDLLNGGGMPILMFFKTIKGSGYIQYPLLANLAIFKERFEKFIQIIQSNKIAIVRKFLQRLSLWNTSYFANNVNPDYYLSRNYYDVNDGGFLRFDEIIGIIPYNTGVFKGRFTPPISISLAEAEQLQLFVYGTFCNYHSNDFAQCLYWGSTLDFIEPTLFDMYLCIPYYDKYMNGSNIYYSHGLFYTEIKSKSAQEKYVYIPNSVTTSNNSALINLIITQTGSLRVPTTLDNTVGYDGDKNVNSINYTGYGGLADVPERPNTDRIAPENYRERFVGQITPQILAKMPNMMRRLITSWSFNRINRTLDSILSSDGTGFKITQFRRNIDKAVYLIGLSYNNWSNATDPDTKGDWSNYLTKYLYNGITIGARNTLMQRRGQYWYNDHWRYAGVFNLGPIMGGFFGTDTVGNSGDGHFTTYYHPNPEICALAYGLFIKFSAPNQNIDGITINRTNFQWWHYVQSGTTPMTAMPNNHVYYSISGSNNNLSWNRFAGHNNDERELSDQSLSAMVADFKANIKKVLPDYGIASNINILDQKMLDSVAQSFYEYSDGLFEISYIYDVYPIGSNMFDIRFDKKQRLGPLAYINLRNSYQPRIIEYNNLVSLYEQNTWQEKYSDVNDLLSNISTIKTRDLEPVFNPAYTLSNRNPDSIRSEISRAIQSNVTLKTELAVLTNTVTTVMNQSNTSAISNYFDNLINSPGSDMIKINLVQSKIDSNDNLLNNLSNQLDGIETNVARIFFTMPTTKDIIINGVALGPNAALTYNPIYSAGLQADMGQSQGNVNYQPTIVYTKNVTSAINPYYISFIKQAAQLYIDSIYNSLSSFTSNTYVESNGYIRVDKVFGAAKLDDKTVGFTWQESQYDFYTNKPNVQRIVDVKLKFAYDNTEYQNPQIYIDNNVSNIYIGSNTIDTTATDYTLINNNSIRDYRTLIPTLNSEITSLNNQYIEEIRNFMRTSYVFFRVFEQSNFLASLNESDLDFSPNNFGSKRENLYQEYTANGTTSWANIYKPFLLQFVKKDYISKSLDTLYNEIYNSNYSPSNILTFMNNQVKRVYSILPAESRSNIPWPANIIVSSVPGTTRYNGPMLPNQAGTLINWRYARLYPANSNVVTESFIKNNNLQIDDAIELITYNINMMNIKREQITGYSNLIREQETIISNIRLNITNGKFKFVNLLNDQGNSITWNDYVINYQDTLDLLVPSNILPSIKIYRQQAEALSNINSTVQSLITIRNDAPSKRYYNNLIDAFRYGDANSIIRREYNVLDELMEPVPTYTSNFLYYYNIYYSSYREQRSKADYYTTLYDNNIRNGILTSNIPYSNTAVKLPHRIDEETLDDNDGACPANMTCGNTTIMNQLIDEHNLDSNNSDKILRVFKAFTPNAFRCDYSVEMADSNGRTKKGTIAFDVGQNIEDCSYFISSNNGFNKGYFIIDKVDYVNDTDNKDISGFNFVGNALLGYSNSVKNTFNPLINSASESMSTIYNSLTASRLLTYNALGKMDSINLQGCPEITYDILKNIIINNERFRNTIFQSHLFLDSHMTKIIRIGISYSNTFDIAYQKDNYAVSNNSPVLVNSVTAGAKYRMTITPGFCDYTPEYISEISPIPPKLVLDSNTKLNSINLNSNLPYLYDDINLQNPNNFQLVNPVSAILLDKLTKRITSGMDSGSRVFFETNNFYYFTHYYIPNPTTIIYINAELIEVPVGDARWRPPGNIIFYQVNLIKNNKPYFDLNLNVRYIRRNEVESDVRIAYKVISDYFPNSFPNRNTRNGDAEYSYTFFESPFIPLFLSNNCVRLNTNIFINRFRLENCIFTDFGNSNITNKLGIGKIARYIEDYDPNKCHYLIDTNEELPIEKLTYKVTFAADMISNCSNFKPINIEKTARFNYVPNASNIDLVRIFKNYTKLSGTVYKSFSIQQYDGYNHVYYSASKYDLNNEGDIDYTRLPNTREFKGLKFYKVEFYQKPTTESVNSNQIKVLSVTDITILYGYITMNEEYFSNNFMNGLASRAPRILYDIEDPNPYIGPNIINYLKNIPYQNISLTPIGFYTSIPRDAGLNRLFGISQLQFYKNRDKIINPSQILIFENSSLIETNTFLLNNLNLQNYRNLREFNGNFNNTKLMLQFDTPISIDGFSFVTGKTPSDSLKQWILQGYADGIWLNLHIQSNDVVISNYPSRVYQSPIFLFDNTRYELPQLPIKPPLLSQCINIENLSYITPIIDAYPYNLNGNLRFLTGISFFKIDNINNRVVYLASVSRPGGEEYIFERYEKWLLNFNDFDRCATLTLTNQSKMFINSTTVDTESDTRSYTSIDSFLIQGLINTRLNIGKLNGCTPPIEPDNNNFLSLLFDKLVKNRNVSSNTNRIIFQNTPRGIPITDKYVDYSSLAIEYVKKMNFVNKIAYILSINTYDDSYTYTYNIKKYICYTIDAGSYISNCSNLPLSINNGYEYFNVNNTIIRIVDYLRSPIIRDTNGVDRPREYYFSQAGFSNYTYSNNISSKLPEYISYLSRCGLNINNSNYISIALENAYRIASNSYIVTTPQSNGNDIEIKIAYTKLDIFSGNISYILSVARRPYGWFNYSGNIIKGYRGPTITENQYAENYFRNITNNTPSQEIPTSFPYIQYLEISFNNIINYETCSIDSYSYIVNSNYLSYGQQVDIYRIPSGSNFGSYFLSVGYTENNSISNIIRYIDNTSNILIPRMSITEKFDTCYSNALDTTIINTILNTPNMFAYTDFKSEYSRRNSPNYIVGDVNPENIYFYKKVSGDFRSNNNPKFYYIVIATARNNIGTTLEFNIEIYTQFYLNPRNGATVNMFQIENVPCSNLFINDYNFSAIINEENISSYTSSNNYTQYSLGGTYRLSQISLLNSCSIIDFISLFGDISFFTHFITKPVNSKPSYNQPLFLKKDSNNLRLLAITKSYELNTSNINIIEWKYDITNIQTNCSFSDNYLNLGISKIINENNLTSYVTSNNFQSYVSSRFFPNSQTRALFNYYIQLSSSGEELGTGLRLRILDGESTPPYIQPLYNNLVLKLPNRISFNTTSLFGSNIGEITEIFYSRIFPIDDQNTLNMLVAFLNNNNDIYYLSYNIQILSLSHIVTVGDRLNNYSYPISSSNVDIRYPSLSPIIFQSAKMRKCQLNELNPIILANTNINNDQIDLYRNIINQVYTNNLTTVITAVPRSIVAYYKTNYSNLTISFLIALREGSFRDHFLKQDIQLGAIRSCDNFNITQNTELLAHQEADNNFFYTHQNINNYVLSNNYTIHPSFRPNRQGESMSNGDQLLCIIESEYDLQVMFDYYFNPTIIPNYYSFTYNKLNSNYPYRNETYKLYNGTSFVIDTLSNLIINYNIYTGPNSFLGDLYTIYMSNDNASQNFQVTTINDDPVFYTGLYYGFTTYNSQLMYKKINTSNITNSYIIRDRISINNISNGTSISSTNSNSYILASLRYSSGISNCFLGTTASYDSITFGPIINTVNISNYAGSNGFTMTTDYIVMNPEGFTNKINEGIVNKYLSFESKKIFKINNFKLYGTGGKLLETDLIKQEPNKLIFEIKLPLNIIGYTFITNSFSKDYNPKVWEIKISNGTRWEVIDRRNLDHNLPINYQLPLIYLDGRIKTLPQPVSKISDKPQPKIEEKPIDKETLVKYYKQKINSSIKPEFKKYMRDNDTYYCLFDAYDLNRNMVGKDLIVGFIMRDGRVKKPVLYEDDEGNYIPFDMTKKTIKEFWDRTIMLPLLFSTSF